jgi:GTPase SAR1 family protein
MKLPPVVQRIEQQTENHRAPICVLVVGMAGSGKTTLIEALQQSTIPDDNDVDNRVVEGEATTADDAANEETDQKKSAVTVDDKAIQQTSSSPSSIPAYCINLDPACLDVPYSPSIDIRDTIDYKQVMSQHKLGPNGAILTSLNLYATKFDQVINILESRADADFANSIDSVDSNARTDDEEKNDGSSKRGGHKPRQLSDYLIVDTPGQIEAFTWSASGQIISESLASTFPTVLVFVVDTVRCASSPNTFMSNMLYACSMYYRSRLPLVIAFNKTDVVSSEFCLEWMRDFEAFQEALDNARNQGDGNEGGFYDSLTRSLSLVLDEFYQEFSKNAVGVSAITGDGIDKFWEVVRQAADTDFLDYIEDLKHRIQEQEAKKLAIARAQARRLQRDIEEDNNSK